MSSVMLSHLWLVSERKENWQYAQSRSGMPVATLLSLPNHQRGFIWLMRHFMTTKNWNSCLKLKTLTTYISVLCASNEKTIQLRIFFLFNDDQRLHRIVHCTQFLFPGIYFLAPFLLISSVSLALLFLRLKNRMKNTNAPNFFREKR